VTRSLVIETDEGKKGRSFKANLLGFVTADHLWEGGRTDSSAIRPIVLVVAASEAQMGPFVANLRGGRKAVEEQAFRGARGGKRFELLRSAGYAFAWQRFPEGAVVTAYLPDLIRLDPGMVDPTGARFLLLPSAAWVDAERAHVDVDGLVAHVERLGLVDCHGRLNADLASAIAPLASLFIAYLDRRVRAPIMPDARFHLQVLLACLCGGLAICAGRDGYGPPRAVEAERTEECGFGLPIAFRATQDAIESLLSEQVSLFFGQRRAA
jgi:hypothetical protein